MRHTLSSDRATSGAAPAAAGSFGRNSRPALVLSAAFVAIFAFRLLSFNFTDDHFDRISRGRQILVWGDVPFQDFFDPGFFLTLYSSAAVQALFGYNLLGETLLTTICIAAGFTLALVLAQRISHSWAIAAAVTLVAVGTMPRLYNYDKVLFLPLGLLLCWRYIDQPTWRRLSTLGVAIAVAGMYRPDNGVYVAIAALVAIAATHGRQVSKAIARGFVLGGIVLAALTPALAFVQGHGGVSDAFRQIAEYARREGLRTRVFSLPVLRIDASTPWLVIEAPVGVRWRAAVTETERAQLERAYRLEQGTFDGGRTWRYQLADDSDANVNALIKDGHVEDTHGISRNPGGGRRVLRRISLLPGVLTRANAASWLYYTLMALPLIALIGAFLARGKGDEAAALWSAGSLLLAANLFLLRDPLDARIGDVAAPAVPLAAWLMRQVFRMPPMGKSLSRMKGLVGAAGVAISCLSVGILWSSEWRPAADLQKFRRLAESPPPASLMPAGHTVGLVTYLRACMRPDDKVLATWFAPEVYFFSGRGFAGGMNVFFGGHWSRPKDQRRTIARLQAQSVPVVVLDMRSYAGFQDQYRALNAYLQTTYVPVADSSLGDSEGAYRVLVRKGLSPDRIDGVWGLPCFR